MSEMNLIFYSVAVSLLFTFLGQSGSCNHKETAMNKAPVATNDRFATGVWGGDHIRLEATDSGASIEYDCAHSTIDQRIVLNRAGKFEVKGRYSREHSGPVRGDKEPNSSAARYVGLVQDKTLTLTVTLTDSGESIGTFTLTHGRDVILRKCR